MIRSKADLGGNTLRSFSRTMLCICFAVGMTLGSEASFAGDLAETRAAAEQGSADAQFSLGVLYIVGDGVSQNYAEAAKWFRLAADRGHAGAQTNLGLMYLDGQGVPQDYVRAHMWFNLAAAQGNSDASVNRGILAKDMTSEQIAEAQRLAREWTPKAE